MPVATPKAARWRARAGPARRSPRDRAAYDCLALHLSIHSAASTAFGSLSDAGGGGGGGGAPASAAGALASAAGAAPPSANRPEGAPPVLLV